MKYPVLLSRSLFLHSDHLAAWKRGTETVKVLTKVRKIKRRKRIRDGHRPVSEPKSWLGVAWFKAWGGEGQKSCVQLGSL